jgi:hypothetical protein
MMWMLFPKSGRQSAMLAYYRSPEDTGIHFTHRAVSAQAGNQIVKNVHASS